MAEGKLRDNFPLCPRQGFEPVVQPSAAVIGVSSGRSHSRTLVSQPANPLRYVCWRDGGEARGNAGGAAEFSASSGNRHNQPSDLRRCPVTVTT